MSVMSQVTSNVGGDRNNWTLDEMRIACGLKISGWKRKDIVTALGKDANGKDQHPESSVTYLFTRKLSAPDKDEVGNQKTEQRHKKVKGVLQYDEQGNPIMTTVKLRRPFTDVELFTALEVKDENDLIEAASPFINAEAIAAS